MRYALLFGLSMSVFLTISGCQVHRPALPELPAWQSSQGLNEPTLGQIQALPSGRVLTPDELVQALSDVPRILVGEKHDNPDHHALQRWLLQALQTARPQGSVVLEMLQPAQQPLIDKVQRQAQLPSDLPAALDWQQGWDWQIYAPIVREALKGPGVLLAGDLSPEAMREAYRRQPVLSGARSNAPQVKAALLEQVREGHCGLLPESQLPAMLVIQQQRDRHMAERLLAAPQPALLLAGAYHARKDLGVPLHLIDLQAQGDTRVLLLAEVGQKVEAGMADYVWYTAALPEQDYCAQLRGG
ncbi:MULTISPECIES: ChaN family lipoprotein [Pseudomonas]|uniref:ChaN family lipoprotein n=1 Tax=Pseudomonas TaxID=286 RepID=UPI0018D5EA7F|nr:MULTISPECIES: ChaN family lipoprotein [Pseudomonas]MBH3463066.1 ChaN family lipoprotein [Pseudomonas putida]MBK0060813.1 ChaN family lipoprotein [Pseudomonas sp. S44]